MRRSATPLPTVRNCGEVVVILRTRRGFRERSVGNRTADHTADHSAARHRGSRTLHARDHRGHRARRRAGAGRDRRRAARGAACACRWRDRAHGRRQQEPAAHAGQCAGAAAPHRVGERRSAARQKPRAGLERACWPRATRDAVRHDLSRCLCRAGTAQAAVQQRDGAKRRRDRQLRPTPPISFAPATARAPSVSVSSIAASILRISIRQPSTEDASAALRRQWGIATDARVILHPARLTGWKGQTTVIEAAGILRARGLLENVVVILAGDAQGREDYVRTLRARIAELDLEWPCPARWARRGHAGGLRARACHRRGLDRARGLRPCGHRSPGHGLAGHCDQHRRARPRRCWPSPRLAGGEITGWLVPPGDRRDAGGATCGGPVLPAHERAALGTRARLHVLEPLHAGCHESGRRSRSMTGFSAPIWRRGLRLRRPPAGSRGSPRSGLTWSADLRIYSVSGHHIVRVAGLWPATSPVRAFSQRLPREIQHPSSNARRAGARAIRPEDERGDPGQGCPPHRRDRTERRRRQPTRTPKPGPPTAGLDLVEISPDADPPVCKILDYGKFKYQEQKKAAEARKRQKIVEIKEIKMRPTTARVRARRPIMVLARGAILARSGREQSSHPHRCRPLKMASDDLLKHGFRRFKR